MFANVFHCSGFETQGRFQKASDIWTFETYGRFSKMSWIFSSFESKTNAFSVVSAFETLRIRADSALYFVIFQRNGNGNVYGREEFDKGHRITTNQISSLFTLFSFPTDSMSTRIRSVRLFTLFFANTNAQGFEGHRITKLSHFRMLWIIFIFFLFCFLAGRKQCNKIKIGLHIFNCFTIHFLIVCPAINLH